MNMNSMLTAGQTESQRVFSGLLYAALASLELDSLKCGCCGDSVAHRPDSILRHLQRHVRFNRFQCSFCGTTTGSLSALEAHAKFSHADFKPQVYLNQMRHLVRREICAVVETIFLGVGQMAKLSCALCDEKLLWRWSALLGHVRQHEGNFPYHCLLCNSPFVDPLTALQHLQCVHAGRTVSASCCTNFGTEELVERGLAKCFPIFCDQTLDQLLLVDSVDPTDPGKSSSSLSSSFRPNQPLVNLPMVTPRQPTKSTVYCNLCQAKISKNMSCLIAHAKVHLAYKPLKCEYCNFRHFAMSKIRRHNVRVHGNKPVKQQQACDSLYTDDDTLLLFEDELPPECSAVVEDECQISAVGASPPTSANTTLNSDDASDDDRSLTSLTGGDFNYNTGLFYNSSANGERDLVAVKKETLSNAGDPTLELPSLGKKMCCLCSTYIANNPSSFENHACKHLDYKPYHCHYCTYQSYIRGKVTRHIQQVHSGLPVKIIHKPVPGIKDRIVTMKLRCFPFLAGFAGEAPSTLSGIGGGTGSGSMPPAVAAVVNALAADGSVNVAGNDHTRTKETVVCLLCSQSILCTETALTDHLPSHIANKFFHCPVCTYATNFLIRAKQHVHSAHPQSQETRIVCCPADGMRGLQDLAVKCYGPLAASLVSSDKLAVAAAVTALAQWNNNSKPFKVDDDEDDDNGTIAITTTSNNNNNNNNCTESSSRVENYNNFKHQMIGGTEDDDEMQSSQAAAAIVAAGFLQAAAAAAAAAAVQAKVDDMKAKCQLCSEMVPKQLANLILHSRQHLDHKPYQCAYCSWKSAEEEEVKQHITRSHRNVALKVLFHPERTMVNRIAQRCFPNLNVGDSSQLISSGNGNGNGSPNSHITSLTPVVLTPGTPNANTILRKLVCKLCNGSIADNPKSIGIHVKNHLNYKPYRCPYCRYMSCEQSKARRHVEHVHNISGDAIEVHAEDNIKEKITDMKARCFPNLGHVGLGEVYSNCDDATAAGKHHHHHHHLLPTLSSGQSNKPSSLGNLVDSALQQFDCRICHEKIPFESTDHHARTHLGKPYKCAYCSSRFWSDEKVKFHIQTVHPNAPMNFVFQGNENDSQFHLIRKKCFPDMLNRNNVAECAVANKVKATNNNNNTSRLSNGLSLESGNSSKLALLSSGGKSDRQIRTSKLLSGVVCQICSKEVPDGSLDAHTKSHLGFKPFHCAYCNYKSSSAAKVKSHQESAHPELPPLQRCFTQLTENMNQLITDMRSVCFPQLDNNNAQTTKQSSEQLISEAEQLRLCLAGELEAISLCWGDDTSVDRTATTTTASNCKNGGASTTVEQNNNLTCQLCKTSVSGTMNSIGLHVRSHLNYEPHYEMSYNAEQDVHKKIANMRRRCFPRVDFRDESELAIESFDIAEIFWQSGESLDLSGESAAQQATVQLESMESISSLMNTMLGTSDLNFTNPIADLSAVGDISAEGESYPEVECQICSERLTNDELSKTKHLTKHLGDYEFRCYYCDFSSFVQTETLKHVTASHAGSPVRVTRTSLGTAQISAAYERLGQQCFPRGGPPINTTAAVLQKITCALCSTTISSADDDQLWAHVRRHKTQSHYKCPHCSFMHSHSSKAKEHVKVEHSDKVAKLSTVQMDVDDETVWRGRCFPDWNVHAGDDGELDDLDELEEVDDEEENDDENGASNATSATATKRRSATTRVLSADGPRYICQLCKSPVSMYASSLYVHVKNHMNYKPYCCGNCDYKSPVKSKVRRHIQNAHKNVSATINYFPTPGIDHEVLRWKKKCFPEVTSFATLANDKVPCFVCKTDVADTFLSKSVHAKNHLDSKPYHCGYCLYKSCLRGETRRHVVRQHLGLPVNVVFVDKEVATKEKVTRMIEQCFGSAGTSKKSATSTQKQGGNTVPKSLKSTVSCVEEKKGNGKISIGSSSFVASSSSSSLTSRSGSSASSYRLQAATAAATATTSRVSKKETNKEATATTSDVRLGQPYRVWHCSYCDYMAHSKYIVKQHCVSEHPGQPVEVLDVNRMSKK
ncbi:zinc finger, C2H2 type [Trichinella nativa]|uniref:Zinc finger, C2H2 type n=1 Tax=Trichinella nativa TaxID=6335 RepID=A0A1Y3ET91_9BILA|nr:zinc finger, C2H2 type [Trichinella nativa]